MAWLRSHLSSFIYAFHHEPATIQLKSGPMHVPISCQLGYHNLDISNRRVLLHIIFDNGVIRRVGVPVQDAEHVKVRTPWRAPVHPADLGLVRAVPFVQRVLALGADGRVRPPA